MDLWKVSNLKAVTICRGGNVRSVTLAYVLKYKYHVDAVAIGHEGNSATTKHMLSKWADVIIVAESYMQDFISKKYAKKTIVLSVGEDIWGMALHPELIALCDRLIMANEFLMTQIEYASYKDESGSKGLTGDKVQKREKILDEVVTKLVSGPIGEALNGMTVKELWHSLSQEDKYFLKMQMYKEKLIHDKSEFMDPTIKLDIKIDQ